jgi:hypothetical protein
MEENMRRVKLDILSKFINKNGDRFKALIKHKKIQYDLGTYDTIEEAKNIYNKYKKRDI